MAAASFFSIVSSGYNGSSGSCCQCERALKMMGLTYRLPTCRIQASSISISDFQSCGAGHALQTLPTTCDPVGVVTRRHRVFSARETSPSRIPSPRPTLICSTLRAWPSDNYSRDPSRSVCSSSRKLAGRQWRRRLRPRASPIIAASTRAAHLLSTRFGGHVAASSCSVARTISWTRGNSATLRG